MTVANVVLESGRACLISDTLSYSDANEPVCLRRKINIVEHAHLAFMVRGKVKLALALHAAAALWENVHAALEQVAGELPAMPLDYFPTGAEVTIVGWQEGRPRAARLWISVLGSQVKVRREDLVIGAHLAPSLGKHAIPTALTDAQIYKIALLQQDISIRHRLNLCVGGDIQVVEFDARGISIRKIGEYPDKAKVVQQILENLGALRHDPATVQKVLDEATVARELAAA